VAIGVAVFHSQILKSEFHNYIIYSPLHIPLHSLITHSDSCVHTSHGCGSTTKRYASWIASLDPIHKPPLSLDIFATPWIHVGRPRWIPRKKGSLPSTKTSPRRSLDSQRATLRWSMIFWSPLIHVPWKLHGESTEMLTFVDNFTDLEHVHFPYEWIHVFKTYTFMTRKRLFVWWLFWTILSSKDARWRERLLATVGQDAPYVMRMMPQQT
jgi:hypothetical protein